MSRAPSGGSSRPKDDWTDVARKAFMRVESGREHSGTKIKCSGNLLLYVFLVELRSAMEASDPDRHRNALFNIKKAQNDVKAQTYRLVTRQHLLQLSGCKDMLSNIIERNLWSLYPPEPEDEEELELRAQAERAAQATKKAAAAAKRQEQQAAQQAAAASAARPGSASGGPAAAAAATGVSGGAGATSPGVAFRQPGVAAHNPLEELTRIFGRDPTAAALREQLRQQMAAQAGAGTAPAAASAAAGPKKRGCRKKAAAAAEAADVAAAGLGNEDPPASTAAVSGGSRRKGGSSKAKDYMPRAGTANYAFTITLYLAHRTGSAHMTKDQLIAAADSSKLADIPIQGNTNAWAAQRGAQKWYDGWSNIKTLENRDTPLIQRWSNPCKIRLTAAGMILGASLYRHAVESGKMTPHAQVPHDEEPPPGSPTAAAGAAAYGHMPGSTAGAAAAGAFAGSRPTSAAAATAGSHETAAAAAAPAAAAPAAKKPRKTKAAAATTAPASQQYSQAGTGAVGSNLPQPATAASLDPAVVAAVTAAEAATRLGSAAADFYCDEDPCSAGDGLWGFADDACGNARCSGGSGQQQQRQQRGKRRSVTAGSTAKKPRHSSRDVSSSSDGWSDSDKDLDAGFDSDTDAAAAVSADDLATLVAMGFEQQASHKALQLCAGSMLDAITYLTDVVPSQQQQEPTQQSAAATAAAVECSGQQQRHGQPARESQPLQDSQHQPLTQQSASWHPQQSQQQQFQHGTQQSAAGAAGFRQAPGRSMLGNPAGAATGVGAAAAGARKRNESTDLYSVLGDQEEYFDDIVLHYHAYLLEDCAPAAAVDDGPDSDQLPQQRQQQATYAKQPRVASQQQEPNGCSRPDMLRHQQRHQQQPPVTSSLPDQQRSATTVSGRSKPPVRRADSAGAGARTAAAAGATVQPQRSGDVAGNPSNVGTGSGCSAAAAGNAWRSARATSEQPSPPTGSATTYVGIDTSTARCWSAPLLSQPLRLRTPPLDPGQVFSGVYDIVLLIDQREQYNRMGPGRTLGRTESLQRYAAGVAAAGVKVDSTVTLACGDVVWVAQHRVNGVRYVLDFLAERKSYDDLSASIIDGRYSHQKWVMAGDAAVPYCLYILEGSANDLSSYNQVNASKALACVTAMHQTLLHDGFKVLETGGPAESIDLLIQMSKLFSDLYSPLTAAADAHPPSVATTQYGGVEPLEAWNARISGARRTKTVRQKWQELLLSVNGIGVEAVHAVIVVYPTPSSLFRAYESAIRGAMAIGSNAQAAANALLVDVKLPGGGRLGPAKSKVVYEKLYMNGWNLA